MLEKIVLGSYTKKESKGVYQISLDTTNKKLVDFQPLITENNPTYLGIAATGNLYTVTKKETQGGMAAYSPTKDGNYSLINSVLTEGAPPCYVGIDNKRGLVFGANYHQGIISSYKIQPDGGLVLADTVQHVGNGPHENQKSAHAHYADLTPDNRLVTCDLGTDGVYTYDVTSEGMLTEVAVLKMAPGTGPRHIVFHPNHQIAYIVGELASTVIAVSYDEKTGSFETLQTLSTLPKGYTEFNGGGAIRISKDGKFLYTSNRGHNSIAIYSLSEDGREMALVDIVSSEGDFPRDFALNETNEFLVVAHQESDNLTLFSRHKETGKLELIQKDVYAPECVCTYFA